MQRTTCIELATSFTPLHTQTHTHTQSIYSYVYTHICIKEQNGKK